MHMSIGAGGAIAKLPNILSRSLASHGPEVSVTPTVGAATINVLPKKGPRFTLPTLPKLPKHYVLPALSYTGLVAATAGTAILLQPLAAPGIALVGCSVGFPLAVTLAQVGISGGTGVAKAMGGKETDDPRLRKLANEAAAAVGVPAPHVFEIKRKEPNAFATSSIFARDPTVAVTTGLREVLTEDELGAVLAHEMGHLRHKDVLRNMHVAVAAAGLGGIYEVGRFLLRSDDSRRKRKKSKDKDDEGSTAALGLTLMGVGIATQTAAHGLRLMASRDAELKADRAAAEAFGASTMISALQKISKQSARRPADLRNSKGGKQFAFAMISDGPASASAAPESSSWMLFSAEPKNANGVGNRIGRFFGAIGDAMRTHPTLDKRVHALEEAVKEGLVPHSRPSASWW